MLPDLPELFLDLVYGQLSYEDVLVLRCTCKSLKNFVDQKEFTKLNLFVKKYSFHRRLFHTGHSIGHPNSYHSDYLTILRSKRFRKKFVNLQRLIICGNGPWASTRVDRYRSLEKGPGVNLNDLNHFKRLKHLEIDEMPCRTPCRTSSCIKGTLNLPELQIAAFTPMLYSGSSFELNCPKLKALMLKWCSPVLSNETSQLVDLCLFNNEEEFLSAKPNYLAKNLAKLQKLSTIRFHRVDHLIEFLYDLKTNTLSLPVLKEIRLENCIRLLANELNDLARKMENFQIKFQRNAQMKCIEFSLNGEPINTPKQIRQFASRVNTFEPKIREFDRLTEDELLRVVSVRRLHFILPAVHSICFRKNLEISKERIKKLDCIEMLIFRERYELNETRFKPFADNCKFLKHLGLGNQTLTQALFEMFANQLVNLQSISIWECTYESLRPLTKFRNLESLEFDFSPPRDELEFIFTNSPRLEEVIFKTKIPIHLLRTSWKPSYYLVAENKMILNPETDYHFGCPTVDCMLDCLYKELLFGRRGCCSSRRGSRSNRMKRI